MFAPPPTNAKDPLIIVIPLAIIVICGSIDGDVGEMMEIHDERFRLSASARKAAHS
jgi:hypothetical protein